MYLPKCWKSQHEDTLIGHWVNMSHPGGFTEPQHMTSSPWWLPSKLSGKVLLLHREPQEITQDAELNTTGTHFHINTVCLDCAKYLTALVRSVQCIFFSEKNKKEFSCNQHCLLEHNLSQQQKICHRKHLWKNNYNSDACPVKQIRLLLMSADIQETLTLKLLCTVVIYSS